MKKMLWILMAGAMLLGWGCSGDVDGLAEKEEELKPTFLFWNFRKEIVSSDYTIPRMTTPEITDAIRSQVKGLPGYVDSSADLETHTLTIRYASSMIRKMNFEEAIAQAGFDVNFRPAYQPNPNGTR